MKSIFSIALVLGLGACGPKVPLLSANGEDQLFVQNVHVAVQCELKDAIDQALVQAAAIGAFRGESLNFFETWGLQYTLTLKVVEQSTTGISVFGTNEPGPASELAKGEIVATGGPGFSLTKKATLEETDRFFGTVDVFSNSSKCSNGQQEDVDSSGIGAFANDLGIGKWLRSRIALVDSEVITSIPKNGSFTYKVVFDINKSASLAPKWSYIMRSLSSVSGSANTTRNTVHTLGVTWGPTEDVGRQLVGKKPAEKKLIDSAVAIHNAHSIGLIQTQ